MLDDPVDALVSATIAMHAEDKPLMRRFIPDGAPVRLMDHYPVDDIVSPDTGSRYFYHVHAAEERGADEHGHFHLFLARAAMREDFSPLIAPPGRAAGAGDAVHIAALSIDHRGLPTRLFTVNRWVTDEWLFNADAVIAALHRFDLRSAPGDALANLWITACVTLCRAPITALLRERDALIATAGFDGEDRAHEILSTMPIDLQALIE